VQFYEREPFLVVAVADQLAEALRRGEPIVMVTRRTILDGVVERLSLSEGLSIDQVADRITFIDVHMALSVFMDGSTLDPVRFEEAVTGMLALIAADTGGRPVWMFGEMAHVLCRGGNPAAAIRIEEIWNAMSARHTVSVICAYALEDFDADASHLRKICRLHSHVNPAEGISEAPDDRARFEQIALLQQRSRTLDRILARESPSALAANASLAASTVYIVDDDPSVRQSLTRLLSTVEMRVQAFPSAEAFLAEVDRQASGCLILDIQLAGMTGPELQSWMANANWVMPVIAMTASDDAQIETKALRLGACAFLRKPFEASALFGAIARALTPEAPKPAPGVPRPTPGGPHPTPGGPTQTPGGPHPTPGGPTPTPGGPNL
jgi:CheY-like chemotaxis protein